MTYPDPKTNGNRKEAPDTLATALAYRRAGLSIVPVARDGSKAPDGRLLPEEWDKARSLATAACGSRSRSVYPPRTSTRVLWPE